MIISELPPVSSHVLDTFPHIHEHINDLSAPIPRGPQKVDAIIGVRDVVKIYKTFKRSTKCPSICLMNRVDGVESTLEARQSMFGTIITGCSQEEKDDNVTV